MKVLTGKEELQALSYLEKAAEQALHSSCYRSRCGSVIVNNNNKIIGAGYNSPPGDVCLESCLKNSLPANFKSDKTCCMHAEQRAIVNALKNNFTQLPGSRLYFIRLDEQGNKQTAGKPYCTICSKMTLDVGIAEFVLWHEEGITVYDAKEYNELSFAFSQ
ncbi:hypothetical protein HYX13_02650 [Candidatus Woesearchaeota archaeon]|nr:hypothetical protein [Candidatus Woesearchaeota archaeon]